MYYSKILKNIKCTNHYKPRRYNSTYDFDLIVIGGGSGGLAASKEAASFNKKVAVCDFVSPSPQGSVWGLGGTCVNVGCIPKKLFHQASLLKEGMHDSKKFGWDVPSEVNISWEKLVEAIQMHIKSLNWGYKSQLKDNNVTYFNELASFVDNNTIQTKNKKGKITNRTAKEFIISVGGRPLLPDIPGIEHVITSDDIFSLPNAPGKTLVVGASYVALECAGFLKGLGYDTTVMARSILLRGFDQQIAEMIGEYMEKESGVKFIKPAVPSSIEKIDGKLVVTYKLDNKEHKESYDTVLYATGRTAETKNLNLDELGLKLGSSGKIQVNNFDQSSISNIYAIGDVAVGRPELTPTAIKAGRLLARRLYNEENLFLNYDNIPTTVFTPLEYGCVGFSEEDAIKKYGEENIEVYHSHFQPLEFTIPERPNNACYLKLICNKADSERVVGFHILSPNAGEITQGIALAMNCGATKHNVDMTVGIHPTIAEEMTTLNITKRSGKSPQKTSC